MDAVNVPGETLAPVTLLLALVRFLQLTKDYSIKLESDNYPDILEPDNKSPIIQNCRSYKIKFIMI